MNPGNPSPNNPFIMPPIQPRPAIGKPRKSQWTGLVRASVGTVNVLLLHRRAIIDGAPLDEAGPVAGLHIELRASVPDLAAWHLWTRCRSRPRSACVIHRRLAYCSLAGNDARCYVIQHVSQTHEQLTAALPFVGSYLRADTIAIPEPERYVPAGVMLRDYAAALLAWTFGEGAVYMQTGGAGTRYCGPIR